MLNKQFSSSELVAAICNAARYGPKLAAPLLLPLVLGNTDTGEYKVGDGDDSNYWMSFANRTMEGAVQGTGVVVDDKNDGLDFDRYATKQVRCTKVAYFNYRRHPRQGDGRRAPLELSIVCDRIDRVQPRSVEIKDTTLSIRKRLSSR